MSTGYIARQKAEKNATKRKIEKANEKSIKVPKQYNLSTNVPIKEPKEIKVDIALEN